MCRQSPASGCPGNIPKTTRLLGGCNWVPGVHAELRVRARGPVCLKEGLVADRTSLGPQGQGRRGPGCCPARLEAVRVCTGLRRMAARAAE